MTTPINQKNPANLTSAHVILPILTKTHHAGYFIVGSITARNHKDNAPTLIGALKLNLVLEEIIYGYLRRLRAAMPAIPSSASAPGVGVMSTFSAFQFVRSAFLPCKFINPLISPSVVN
jgi:hypothetical protein